MKKVLITGITGFAGSALAEHLLTISDYSIEGTYLSEDSLINVSSIKDKLKLHKIDLTHFKDTNDLIKKIDPDFIFHLAAISFPGNSFENPQLYLSTNINAQLSLLEALRKNNMKHTRFLVVSSGDIYGLVEKEDLPIDEDTPLRPINPYGVSKLSQDFLGLQYYLSYGFGIIRIRPFNQIGRRLSEQLVTSAFSKKIAEIEVGKREPVLKVGSIEAKRDFTNIADMVEVYRLVLEKGEVGEVYNAGSGVSYKIKDILDMLLSYSKVSIRIEEDPALLRPMDIPELRCDNTKIHSVTGWKPRISIEDSLKEILEYWREQVK